MRIPEYGRETPLCDATAGRLIAGILDHLRSLNQRGGTNDCDPGRLSANVKLNTIYVESGAQPTCSTQSHLRNSVPQWAVKAAQNRSLSNPGVPENFT